MKDGISKKKMTHRAAYLAATSLIAVVSALAGLLFLSGEVSSMNADNIKAYEAGSLPQMDLNLPEEVKTATFALG